MIVSVPIKCITLRAVCKGNNEDPSHTLRMKPGISPAVILSGAKDLLLLIIVARYAVLRNS